MGDYPKKDKKVVCSLYMGFSEFSLVHLVSGVFFSPAWWNWVEPWRMVSHQPSDPKIDGQNLLIIFRVNGNIEVANVPLHNQRDWSGFHFWTSYRTELLGQWIFPLYIFWLFCQKIWFSSIPGSIFVLRQSNLPEQRLLGLQQGELPVFPVGCASRQGLSCALLALSCQGNSELDPIPAWKC